MGGITSSSTWAFPLHFARSPGVSTTLHTALAPWKIALTLPCDSHTAYTGTLLPPLYMTDAALPFTRAMESSNNLSATERLGDMQQRRMSRCYMYYNSYFDCLHEGGDDETCGKLKGMFQTYNTMCPQEWVTKIESIWHDSHRLELPKPRRWRDEMGSGESGLHAYLHKWLHEQMWSNKRH